MSVFESELRNGRFVVGQCQRCTKVCWPPTDFCSHCFGDLTWRQVLEPGVLVEFSSKDGKIFAMVEFEGIVRVMGTISNPDGLRPGAAVRIAKCGYEKTPQFLFVAE